MHIEMLRSDKVYNRIMLAPREDKQELYRTEMLGPFREKWNIQRIPFRAEAPGGFDVLTLNDVMYLPPLDIDESAAPQVRAISPDRFWEDCERTVRDSLEAFERQGIELPVRNYVCTVLLGNPKSEILRLNEGYTGDGGIPGYLLTALTPNDYTLPRIRAALVHECNHNVRYQFVRWDQNVTLGELLVSEGLAENFAVERCGEERLGPWVGKTDGKTLNGIVKPALRTMLNVTGWEKIAPRLYGDEIASLQGFVPAGLPYGAGYACGYHLIRHYLRKTGEPVERATLKSADEILRVAEDYWDVQTMVDGA
ncbi:Zn-dependent protease [Saccharibacillus sp. O16]|nr:Zn-dependent protease [Saccharibacillus sp. O16]